MLYGGLVSEEHEALKYLTYKINVTILIIPTALDSRRDHFVLKRTT